ncbi:MULTISPECIES: PDZ domain-containing protein [Streptomyces]|uniref:PDZ domain-containing protein n=1 Tax=Streptomyces caniscabiei TaxID=2746961 RepID=A0ABU4MML1_9ACTN|nr:MULTISPECIES: PDZ domain-containing protein [Streptomyces]MBE4734467.1 PDZ domain-containing protein [Streptomyces caniscabiei]MBE4755338.1 PDZ domain-containing protein [Streptomyces caniscabiei]MBE4772538.1 PDZ domain-containing protein [Streptomyces caniscabiei]MBE4783377.1 PDZ domain-containing protein [Streptomyces caniscabiei]MBE4792681.1 PDZ domain-containing protein [Streptomyces caniscabiei]
MEQTALRPKPMPGGESGGDRPPGITRRPHAAPRRARQRLITLLLALATCVALVLSGVGLATMGATVIGMSRLAELRERASHAPGAQGEQGAPDGPGSSAQPGSFARPDADGRAARDGVPKSSQGEGGSAASVIGAPTRPTLGVEAVDAPALPGSGAGGGGDGGGALVVGVHVPGPGHAAGLVRGDTVLALGGTRTGSASDLARAVTAARPGVALKLLVRHANGARQYLVAVPGVVT